MMTEEKAVKTLRLTFPPYKFLFSLSLALLLPYVARLPVVPIRGWAWLYDYFPGTPGIYLFSLFNAAPGIAWYALARMGKKIPLAFWTSIGGGAGFLLWAHGAMDISISSTAAIALLFIPFYAIGVLVLSWLIGIAAHYTVSDERNRFWTAVIYCSIAVIFGCGIAVQKSHHIVSKESRFPALTIADLPLEKVQLYPDTAFDNIEVIAFDDFDETSGKEFVIFDTNGLTTLAQMTYDIKHKVNFKLSPCVGCIHMHPKLIPDRHGGLLVATSNGVSDGTGKLLWKWQTEEFTRIIPIRQASSSPRFFTYQYQDHVQLRQTDGTILWRDELPVTQIGGYDISESHALMFAVSRTKTSNELTIYNPDGTHRRKIQLPAWASKVEQVDWPTKGHFLVGSGATWGIIDPNGSIFLKKKITDTSFSPYHGPNGTAVKLSAAEEPYLAVMSHGSSGFPRSVLLIVNPKGHIVWQEEIRRIRSMIAAPRKGFNSDVLFVGSLDGILEYKLSAQ